MQPQIALQDFRVIEQIESAMENQKDLLPCSRATVPPHAEQGSEFRCFCERLAKLLDSTSPGNKNHEYTFQIVRRYAESLGVDPNVFLETTHTKTFSETFVVLCMAQAISTKLA